MKRTASGLWVAPNFNILRFRKRERTVTLPNGERAKVWWDDSGTVRQTEHGDHLDALVRPAVIRGAFRITKPKVSVGGVARPLAIRAKAGILKGRG